MNLDDRSPEPPSKRHRQDWVSVALAISTVLTLLAPVDAEHPFVRADSNDDGLVNIADVACTLLYLFDDADGACGRAICLDARDANDDGHVDISDPLFLLEVLFAVDARQIPPPYPKCGLDPTPVDPLGCERSTCEPLEGITLRIGPGTELFSIWSEGYDTAPDQHAVHSVIRFREGSHQVLLDRDTENLQLIESLAFGRDLAPSAPLGPGRFSYHPELFYPYEYHQSFETIGGEWTFQLSYRGETGLVDFDCALLDGEAPEILFFAVLESGRGRRNIEYSCFSPDIWMPARNATPRRLTLDDGTVVTLDLEEGYLFRGVAGETANRRLTGATVELSGETIHVTGFEHLVYAALHHNSQQEFRVLFDAPRGLVHGLDVIDCPPGVGPPFFCYVPTPGESKAYLLNAALERTTELTVTDAEIGERPE